MGKVYGEKLKILYLKDFLLQNTDEQHPVSVQEMLEHLEDKGIIAERRSIGRDLKVLGSGHGFDDEDEDDDADEGYGLDVRKKGRKFYIGERFFTLQEVKLLVDMVQTSNFITKDKTDQLIKKLMTLTNKYEAGKLNRNVFIRSRIKNMNESVYDIVDAVSEAINEDRVLHFQYFTYAPDKSKKLRHEGQIHTVSPFALIWVDQNYYMLGYNHDAGQMRHFRVDRMTNVASDKGPRLGKAEFEKEDMSLYTTKVFYMFTGKTERVKMRFANDLASSVIDRFGEDIILVPDGDEHFVFEAEIVVSQQFYAWISAFEDNAEILWPESVRAGMRKHIRKILKLYGKKKI